jgi:hypothetical protein
VWYGSGAKAVELGLNEHEGHFRVTDHCLAWPQRHPNLDRHCRSNGRAAAERGNTLCVLKLLLGLCILWSVWKMSSAARCYLDTVTGTSRVTERYFGFPHLMSVEQSTFSSFNSCSYYCNNTEPWCEDWLMTFFSLIARFTRPLPRRHQNLW